MKRINQINQNRGVVISPNLKKVSERVDIDGNIINPRTKQIIRKNNDK